MSEARPAGRGRRMGVLALMLLLFVVAVAVFVLPFAFPTPPPIVTRFSATQLFSPNGDGRRDEARVNVRVRETSRLTVEIRSEGERVVALIDDELDGQPTTPGFISTTWDGRDAEGRPVADGTYSIKLLADGPGEKVFERSRNVIVDTAAPRPAAMTVVSGTLGEPGPGECRLELTSRDRASVVLEAVRAGADDPVRRLGARPVRPDQPVRWIWDGRAADGTAVPPGLVVIRATLSDAARNRAVRERTCWIGHLAGTPTIARPRPRDRVGAVLRRTDGTPLPADTPVALTLRRRTGVPGVTTTEPLGPVVGREARGRAGRVRVTLPPGINPAALWLVATTLDGRSQALIDLGGGG